MPREYGIKPDVVSYNTLINAYRRVGDVDGAARRVQEMLDCGLKPDTTTYNTLLKMCASRGDVAGAENIFNLIKQSGFQLDPYAYEALASAYVAVKDMDKAEAILKQVTELSSDISPTPIWNTVLSAHAAMGNDERVNQIFELMHQREVPFDYYTYGIVMHCLCLAGKMESAEQTLTYMKEAKFHINTDKYAILMVGYLRLGEFRMVWETFKKMLDDGLKADFKTLAVLLKSYAHAEVEEDSDVAGEMVHLAATEKTLDEITTEVRDLDLASFDSVKSATPPWLFTPLINVYFHKQAWDRAISIFARFLRVSEKEEYGASPNFQMYKSMMRVYHAGGDVEGVRHMWEGLKTFAVQLHKAIDLKQSNRRAVLDVYRNEVCSALSILIKAMAETKDIDTIDEEVKSIQGFGYELDNVNWNDYVQALVLAGKLTRAAEVCEKNLMSRWHDVRLYFFYQDPSMRGEEGKELPTVRPFIRTIEAIATELKSLEELRKRGDPTAKGLLVDIYRNAPTTWEACDGLEDLEGRASKEMMFRLQKSGEEQMVRGGGGNGYY
jgi:pentatricopeptide repeat-containing protein PET309